MTQSIYFASTILHLYAAASIAAGREEEQAHLVFIDQPEGVDFPLFNLVKEWPSSPFSSVRLFPGRFKGLRNKLKQRKALFHKLESLVSEVKPAHIFVGNDRRIEFQYSMHITETLNLNTTGHYMDEGTFTYVGRKASGSFNDAIIDNALKKLSYGFWWKNPPTVGGSAWIQQAHVAFPDLIHPLLKAKKLVQLDSSRFTAAPLRELSEAIMKQHNLTFDAVNNLDALFTLPHESLFESQPGYRDVIIKVVEELTQRGEKVAVKYHPRNSAADVLKLENSGVTILPSSVSFEAILPALNKKTAILGDLSSTLLIARWLRPELSVTSYITDTASQAFLALFRNLDIKTKRI